MAEFRPGKPRLELGLSAASALTVANQRIPFDTSEVEGDFTSIAGGLVTVSRAGTYSMTAYLNRTGGANSQIATVNLRRNGTVIAQGQSDSSTAQRSASASATVHLDAGDTIDAGILGAQTGGKNADVGSYLAMTRVGPKRWT